MQQVQASIKRDPNTRDDNESLHSYHIAPLGITFEHFMREARQLEKFFRDRFPRVEFQTELLPIFDATTYYHSTDTTDSYASERALNKAPRISLDELTPEKFNHAKAIKFAIGAPKELRNSSVSEWYLQMPSELGPFFFASLRIDRVSKPGELSFYAQHVSTAVKQELKELIAGKERALDYGAVHGILKDEVAHRPPSTFETLIGPRLTSLLRRR